MRPKCSEIPYFCCLLALLTSRWAPRPAPDHSLIVYNLHQSLSPGGAVDGFGRPQAKQLSTRLNDPIVVDNCRGAGGTVGALHHSIAPTMCVNLS